MLFYNEGKNNLPAYFGGKFDEANATFGFDEARFIKTEDSVLLLMNCISVTDVIKPKEREWKFTEQVCTLRFKKEGESKYEQWFWKYVDSNPELSEKYYKGHLTVNYNPSLFSMLNDSSQPEASKAVLTATMMKFDPIGEPTKLATIDISSLSSGAKGGGKYGGGNYQRVSKAEQAEETWTWMIGKLKPYTEGVTNCVEYMYAIKQMQRDLGDKETELILDAISRCIPK